MIIYVTFGQTHVHSVNGKTFDKDSVAEIQGKDYADCRRIASEIFGPKFCTTYQLHELDLYWFPRGVIKAN